MRNKLQSLLLPLLLLLTTQAQALTPIQHWQTDNGARVYFIPANSLPMVDIRVTFDAGAARDGAQPGIGLMTNGMLAEGAGEWDANTISQRFDSVGARFSNSSLRDMSIFTLRSLIRDEQLQPALTTFATVLSAPTFPQAAFERERNNLLLSLRHEKQEPGEIAEKAFYQGLYGDHPYAEPVKGTEQSIKALTTDDLRAHYRRYFVARNAVVAIVGALERAQAETIAEQVTAGLKPGQRAADVPSAAEREQGKTQRITFDSQQSHIWMGQIGISRDDPDYFDLTVGNYILGGSSLISRIGDEIREKRGLAYSAYSYLSPMAAQGPYLFGLQTANKNVDEALGVLRNTVADYVKNGPTGEELTRAKQKLIGGFPLQIDSNSDLVGYLGSIGFYDLPLDYLETYTAKVEAVSVESIRDAFQRRVHPQRMLTVVVGNGND